MPPDAPSHHHDIRCGHVGHPMQPTVRREGRIGQAGRVRFFTADLHLGHRNIIGYTDRPFADVDEMNHALIDNWNDMVRADDEVVVLGDFALGRINETLPLARRLNGRKVLLAGNHDRCWEGHSRHHDRETRRYLEAGFDEIWQGTVRLDLAGIEVLACHFPTRATARTATATSPTARWTGADGCSTATSTSAGRCGTG